MMHRIAYAIAGAVLGVALIVAVDVLIFSVNAYGALPALIAASAAVGAMIGWYKA